MDSEWYLSDLANGIERSKILSIAADVRKRKEAGEEVAAFTVGDFSPEHFNMPSIFHENLIEAIERKQTNYPPAAGLPELRTVLADWMLSRYGVDVGADGIIVGSGARPVLFASFKLFLSPGDGLAHGVPAWNNHYYVHLNSAKDIPIVGDENSRFLPTAAGIADRISEIRVLILNSPLNPTGTCFTRAELAAICDVVLTENERRRDTGKKPIILVYDQVYSTMTTENISHVHPVQVRPAIGEFTITLDAISKSLTGTGMRLGWMAIPPTLAPPVIALIGHMGAWPARPIQSAAAVTYSDSDGLENYFEELDRKIALRMDLLMEKLGKLRDKGHQIDFIPPQGGIYLSTRFNLFNQLKVSTNEEIRQWLLEHCGFAVVPFQAFGLDEESGWFRISVGAVSVTEVEQALERLKIGLQGLKK